MEVRTLQEVLYLLEWGDIFILKLMKLARVIVERDCVMFFNFTFRHFITKPEDLAEQLQNSTMRGFKKRVLFTFLAGVILFAFRNWWGLNAEVLTPVLTTMTTADYTLARYASLLGSVLWSLIYMSFHLFGFAYILSFVTFIPFKKLLPLQLLMMSILLVEKGLVFLVFAMKGAATNVSFLSFGPLAATFIEAPFFIFFLNQISITTVIIIAFQYRFSRSFIEPTETKRLIWSLIGIHLAIALIIAAFGFIPMDLMFDKFIGGGVGNE